MKQKNDLFSSAKYITPANGKEITREQLEKQFPTLYFTGEIGKTGIVGINKKTSDIEIFIRHPQWVPTKQPDGSIEYGGIQTEEYIMQILGRTFGKKATIVSDKILKAIQKKKTLPYGALRIGKESEAIAISPSTGEIIALPKKEQVEFQRGVHEDAMPVCNTLEEAILCRCRQIVKRANSHPNSFILDVSVPLTGSPTDKGMQLNAGKAANYIRPWAKKLQEHLVTEDTQAKETINALAQSFGYADYTALIADEGFQTVWPMLSSQTNIGMPHIFSKKEKKLTIPLEIVIATADLLNSNLGVLVELLMVSSPIIFGKTPKVKDVYNGKTNYITPHDYRMVLRYLFETAWPAEHIYTRKILNKRWEDGTLTGLMYTIDRLSYQTKLPDRETTAVIYGAARVRVETKNNHIASGRIESTLSGSSPSLLDEIAHDTLLYLFSIAAIEATANNMQPHEYFGKRFPNIKKWEDRKNLSRLFNFYGGKEANISNLIDEGLSFLEYMEKQYSSLKDVIYFVKQRIENLRSPSLHSLSEYKKTPQGLISGAMIAMLDKGDSPLQISKAVKDYQEYMAQKILQIKPNMNLFHELNLFSINVSTCQIGNKKENKDC